jgi:transposase
MTKRQAREFRRALCERLVAGERISKVSSETGVSEATLHRWRDQALIDADLKAGTKSVEVDELAQARRTIEELEAELAAVKAASALFNGDEPVSPKAASGCRGAEQPGLLRACGLSGRRGIEVVLVRAQIPRARRPTFAGSW